MATKRIKDITNTAASVASDAYLAIDGTSNGTEKITRDNFRQDTADAFVAAPGTYNLAPLVGGAVEVAKGGTGSTTAAGARTNLSVNSRDEDAQANALKTTAPALYFDGSSSYVTVADDDKLSFTDGTDDLPFSLSCWAKISQTTNNRFVAKYGNGGASTQEYFLFSNGSGYLAFQIASSGGDAAYITADADLTNYVGKWSHFAVSYNGAGPNSSNGFTAAMNGAKLFINGEEVASTPSNNASYAGMADTAQGVWVGRATSVYHKGSIRDVKIFNRTLTSTEIAQLARGNDLGFAEEWGGALGGVYTSDFSAGVDGFTASAGTVTGNIDSIGGLDDNLRLIVDNTSAGHYVRKNGVFTIGKRYRVSAYVYIAGSNDVLDGAEFRGFCQTNTSIFPSVSTWSLLEVETVAIGTDLFIYARDQTTGTAATFQDAGGDDVFYIRNITVTEIGCLASFSAERYDTSTNKLYDISDNAFVGTGTSVSLTGREVPVYSHGTWTPSITFGGGSTGVTYGTQEGYYTRVGNQVTVHGDLILTAKGTDTGQAVLRGLPFTVKDTSNSSQSLSVGQCANMASLTSAVTGVFTDNNTTIILRDWGATGTANLDDTNFTSTSIIRFSGTYQIQ
jgi:hypothetical protein